MLDRPKVFCEYKGSLSISPSYDRRIPKTLVRLANPFSSFLLGPDYPMKRLVGPLHRFDEMSSPFFLTPKIYLFFLTQKTYFVNVSMLFLSINLLFSQL